MPALRVAVDGRAETLTPDQLRDTDSAGALAAKIASSTKPAVVSLTDLLYFTDSDRWIILDFVSGLSTGRIRVGHDYFDRLLDAALAHVKAGMNADHLRRAKLAVLEVAVLSFADCLDVPCARLQAQMRKVGIKGVRLGDLVRDARQIAKAIAAGKAQGPIAEPQQVSQLFTDAPAPQDLVVPRGWHVSARGIVRLGRDNKHEVTTAPIIITERAYEIQRGIEAVTLAWLRDGAWHSRIVDRGVIATSRRVVELADYGLPINSGNAAEVVEFLSSFEAENLPRLKPTKVSAKLGWQGTDGEYGFLCGTSLITDAGIADKDCSAVRFRGTDIGDEQLIEGFRHAGDFASWIEAVGSIAEYPRVLLALYTSFLPPLLPILHCDNFVLDFAGETSLGKTTTLQVAASAWGCPSVKYPGITFSWNTTATWRERVPAVLGQMPFILDDTKLSNHPEEIAKTIYSITQGRGRGRGTIGGLAHQNHCETVLFSSGEQPAVSFTQDGGTRARVLTLWGSPFGEASKMVATTVNDLVHRIQQHHGHAGPRFVEYLLLHRHRWHIYRDKYQKRVTDFRQRAGNNAVACRMAAPLAAISIAAKIAHHGLKLPWDWTDPIEPLWEEMTRESGDADRASAALRHAMSWAVAHADDFYDSNKPNEQPSRGWAGRWDRAEHRQTIPDSHIKRSERDQWIGFLPHVLEQLLSDDRYDVQAVIRTWQDRDWLITDKEAKKVRTQYKTRINKGSARVYALRCSAAADCEAV